MLTVKSEYRVRYDANNNLKRETMTEKREQRKDNREKITEER